MQLLELLLLAFYPPCRFNKAQPTLEIAMRCYALIVSAYIEHCHSFWCGWKMSAGKSAAISLTTEVAMVVPSLLLVVSMGAVEQERERGREKGRRPFSVTPRNFVQLEN